MGISPQFGDTYPAEISSRLLAWFATHKRNLPWRMEPRSPYHVWLAEIMLQQTQVTTVIPYYQRWLQRFPTLITLASAPLDDVLKMWEGLGYYSRARNFHRAAQMVERDFAGRIPDIVEDLLKLPGIGRYTAGAIASLAFHRDTPILDGNVARVLSRVFAISGDVKSPDIAAGLWNLSAALLPAGRAGEFNEALMDLGATICTPRAPQCPECPFNDFCTAYAKGNPEAYPEKVPRKPLPHRDIGSAVILDPSQHILMARRPAKGLLGGLWEFPGGEISLTSHSEHLSRKNRQLAGAQLQAIIKQKTGVGIHIGEDDFIGQVKHAFTHFQMTRHIALVKLARGQRMRADNPRRDDAYSDMRWVTREEIAQLALTRSDQKIARLALHDGLDAPQLL